jgi:single-strand selective monofunctional uracil DNA glycosylase
MVDSERLVQVARDLGRSCQRLVFRAPVAYVYNPLDYAWAPHETYLRRYARGGVDAVLVGMNPGPFGMLQTGVPFGDVGMVRDWLGIEAPVAQPQRQHPKRPVQGFAIRRGEVSGRRVWGWARERFQTPERFFARFFVTNYCPLGLFDHNGANLTPDALRGEQRDALYAVCDHALGEMLRALQPRAAIGIGRFAEQRLNAIAPPLGIAVGGVTHPSPANPRAHGGWGLHMGAAAQELGIDLP